MLGLAYSLPHFSLPAYRHPKYHSAFPATKYGIKPYYQDAQVTIFHGDCREILPRIDAVDLVIADPPYVFGLASTCNEGKFGSWGDLMNNSYVYAAWLNEFQRLTAQTNGAVWMFNSWRSFPVLARSAMEVGWPITSLLVWDKMVFGAGPKRGLRPSYELAALFVQEEFQIKNRSLRDVWQEKWATTKPTGHAAEKPVALVKKLIQESGGELILDPFVGSGTTLVAAKELGKRAIGIEIEEKYCELAARRAAGEQVKIRGRRS